MGRPFFSYRPQHLGDGPNKFFSSTVRIQSDRGQYPVTIGQYRAIRSPGITACRHHRSDGSAFLVKRIHAEDKLLRSELPGYADYATRTRRRLIPLIY
jgi:hypothetical protein